MNIQVDQRMVVGEYDNNFPVVPKNGVICLTTG